MDKQELEYAIDCLSTARRGLEQTVYHLQRAGSVGEADGRDLFIGADDLLEALRKEVLEDDTTNVDEEETTRDDIPF